MSLLNLLRMPVDGSRGELFLVDPNEREHFGCFELYVPLRKDFPLLKLYFRYDYNPQPADMSRDIFRDKIMEELMRFYNALTLIQSFGSYQLKTIDLPHGLHIQVPDLQIL